VGAGDAEDQLDAPSYGRRGGRLPRRHSRTGAGKRVEEPGARRLHAGPVLSLAKESVLGGRVTGRPTVMVEFYSGAQCERTEKVYAGRST